MQQGSLWSGDVTGTGEGANGFRSAVGLLHKVQSHPQIGWRLPMGNLLLFCDPEIDLLSDSFFSALPDFTMCGVIEGSYE